MSQELFSRPATPIDVQRGVLVAEIRDPDVRVGEVDLALGVAGLDR
jgi:hypothetical protein